MYFKGRKSSQDEQGTVALKTIELDNKLFDGKALQVRVCEGKEPIHFMSIFDGRIAIYKVVIFNFLAKIGLKSRQTVINHEETQIIEKINLIKQK